MNKQCTCLLGQPLLSPLSQETILHIWLITLISFSQTPVEKSYNEAQTHNRLFMGKTFGLLKTLLRCLGESCDTLWHSPASGCREFLARGIVPSTVLLWRAIVFTGRGGSSATCKRPTAGAGWKPRAPCQGGDIITQEQARAGSSPAGEQGRATENWSTLLCTWPCAHRVRNRSIETLV